MKRLLILLTFSAILFSGCTKVDDNSPLAEVRSIAWNYLTDKQRMTVTINWKQAPVTDTVYNEKTVYSIRFNTTDDALLGPIIIYIDKETKEVLGQTLRN